MSLGLSTPDSIRRPSQGLELISGRLSEGASYPPPPVGSATHRYHHRHRHHTPSGLRGEPAIRKRVEEVRLDEASLEPAPCSAPLVPEQLGISLMVGHFGDVRTCCLRLINHAETFPALSEREPALFTPH